jgi:hypothetical protein
MRNSVAYIVLFVIFSFTFLSAQENETETSDKVTVRPSLMSMRAEFSVPTPLNAAWRKSMVGIFEGNISFNYKISHDFFIGVGYKGAMFYVPPKFFLFEVKTKMQMHGAYLKLGYDIYKTNTYFITPSINSGWCYTRFTHINCKTDTMTWKPEYQTWFIEPQVTFNFLPDPNFGICVNLSFVVADHVWNPEIACLQDHIDFSEVRTNKITSYFNLGFGIYWGFGRGRTIAGK